MGWRTVVVSKPSKLDLRLGYMVVRDCQSTVRVHISEISVLIIENTASSVTTALLNELTKQKIKIIFCDEKQNPSSELVSFYGCHDCSLKLRAQIDWLTNQCILLTRIGAKLLKIKQKQYIIYLTFEIPGDL